MVNLKPAKRNDPKTVPNRRSLSRKQLLLLVLISFLVHGLGLFWLANRYRPQSVAEEQAELKPIEFTVIPEETEETIVEQETSDNSSTPPSTPESEPEPEPPPQIAQSSAPPPPTPEPEPQIAQPSAPPPSTPEPEPQIAQSSAPPPSTLESEPEPVATNIPPKPSETTIQPDKPADTDGVSTNANDLLGGDYEKTLASGGDAFFSEEALEYKSVLNPEQLKALKGLDLSQYLADMEGKVKPNWNPSFRQDDRTTVLTFNIEKNGQITGLRVTQSSGLADVDRESLEAVQKSAPFAPLPADFPLEALEITFSFNIYIY